MTKSGRNMIPSNTCIKEENVGFPAFKLFDASKNRQAGSSILR